MTQTESTNVVVAAMYKFVHLPDFRELRKKLLQVCEKQFLKGTLLLAEEGINGTVAGEREGIDNLLYFLKQDPRFADLEHKESFVSEVPFYRMKVRLKKEIVTMGIPDTDPNQLVRVSHRWGIVQSSLGPGKSQCHGKMDDGDSFQGLRSENVASTPGLHQNQETDTVQQRVRSDRIYAVRMLPAASPLFD